MQSDFIVGITSGLVATAIVFLFRSIWNSSLIPWFEERVYKDIKIEGTWLTFYPDSKFERQESVTINRTGHAVTGTMVCTNGPDQGETYKLSGSFRNMLLPLIYESADRTKSDRGSITVKCTRNGERMVGKISIYNDYDDFIHTGTVIWFRQKADFDSYLARHKTKTKSIEILNKHKKQIEQKIATAEGLSHPTKPKPQQEEPNL